MLGDLKISPALAFEEANPVWIAGPQGDVGTVAGLLEWGGPPTIAGLVVSGVVDTIDARAFWRGTHIGKEILELLPALANSDSPATVARVIVAAWILAALPHILP